jgi:type I protein arginine methyltransferase
VYGFDMGKIKDIALTEPLVDIVDSRAVLSNAVPILSLDVLTCKKDVR